MILKNKIKNKDPGFSTVSVCVMCLMIIALIITFAFKMKMYYNTKTFVDDAITNANLSAATIDGYDYGETGNITNFEYDKMYVQYLKTLGHDLNADVIDGTYGVTLRAKDNVHFSSDINVLKFYVYNKTADGVLTLAKVVDSSSENEGDVGTYYGGALEKPITIDKAITPDGTYMEDDYSCMMIYSQISFKINGIFGNSEFYGSVNSPMYRSKEHSVDVITTHGYKEIDRLEPTCVDDGYIIYKCTNETCPNGVGHEYTLVLDKLGHNFLETFTYENNNSVVNGHRWRKCSRCPATTNHQYKLELNRNNYVESVSESNYYNVGDEIDILAVTKAGSVWDGWLGTFNLTNKAEKVVIPEYAVSLTATAHTSYKVQHWKEKIDSDGTQNEANYELVTEDTLVETTTDLTVSPAVKVYTGFISPSMQSVTLASDGSTIINYYYTRNSYNVNVIAGTGIASVTGGGAHKYGETVTITATVSKEHDFAWSGWSGDLDKKGEMAYIPNSNSSYTFVMPARDVTFRADALETVSFAIYSSNDGSLRFYKSTTVPTVGSTYNGKTVTALYKRVNELNLKDEGQAPWWSYRNNIKIISIENKISPVSTAFWFIEMRKCYSVSVENLDMTKCKTIRSMFSDVGRDCETTTFYGLNKWNTSSITDMSGAFSNVGYDHNVVMDNLSTWDVSNVTDMSWMFGNMGRYSKINLNLDEWKPKRVTNYAGMFRATGKMGGKSFYIGNLSNWKTYTSVATDMSQMFSEAGKYSSYSLDLRQWDVTNVSSYLDFNAGVTGKVLAPKWVR